MLTDLEKEKIAMLRNRFTDAEWEQLKASDDYARERIAFYSAQEIASINMNLKTLDQQSQSIENGRATFNNKLSILQTN